MKIKLNNLLSKHNVVVTEELLNDILNFFDSDVEKPLEQRRQEFINSVAPFVEELGKETCNNFCKYWLEKSPQGKKFRFEKEKTFDVKRRLEFWCRNQRKFSIVNMMRK